MSDRKPKPVVLAVIVTVLALLGLYVGAYYAMVRPVDHRAHKDDPPVSDYYATGNSWTRDRGDGWSWNRFFRPINRLDRRLRPNVWKDEP